jgi:transketolase
MIEVTPSKVKLWSSVGPRPTFGLVLSELAKELERLMVVTADVSTSAGLDRFRKTYPEKFIDVGIAEQNMIGVAAGLADNGFEVFTTTFAPFQTLRCCEQIKVDLAYTKTKVTMVGLASGLINGPLGNTHCCIEDVGVLRSIPNINIISPADGVGLVKLIIESLSTELPTYFRLTGGQNNPIVYSEDVNLRIGYANQLKEGKDLVIFAAGTMVYYSQKAALLLAEHGINASVWDMHTIKPIDSAAVEAVAKDYPLLVTVEEHNIIGGLGSAVSECLSRLPISAKHLALGVNDIFLKPGDYQYMLEQSGLLPSQICSSIIENLK